MDVVCIALIALLFSSALGLIALCERLQGDRS
jgi:hypothetical protein